MQLYGCLSPQAFQDRGNQSLGHSSISTSDCHWGLREHLATEGTKGLARIGPHLMSLWAPQRINHKQPNMENESMGQQPQRGIWKSQTGTWMVLEWPCWGPTLLTETVRCTARGSEGYKAGWRGPGHCLFSLCSASGLGG